MDKKILKAAYFKDRAFADTLKKVRNAERILVWGDEDPDGMTATAVLTDTLRKLHKYSDYFIPSRKTDGIGLNKKRLQQLLKKEYDLVITVDCGTVNIDEQEFLLDNNTDVIITDHHIPYRMPGRNVTLINTHKLKAHYFRHLSGSGVALILSVYLLKQLNGYTSYDKALNAMKRNIAIASIGTICDKVKIAGFNKIIEQYYYGLNEYLPLIGALLTPRISACGLFYQSKTSRLKNPIVEILLQENTGSAERRKLHSMSEQCRKQNQYIKRLINRETEKIDRKAEVIIHYNPRINHAYAGVLAGHICRELRKPVLIITRKGNVIAGEARSIKLNWVNVFNTFSKYFKSWGGHKNAAGFSMDIDNADSFINSINSKYNS